MEDLLKESEGKKISEIAKTVKEQAYLSLDVYVMTVKSWERKEDKNGMQYLRVAIDTGYLAKDNSPRCLHEMFYLQGTYPDGKEKIEDLARFLKICFKLTAVSSQSLKTTIGRRLSVATKKDREGYIQFWYAESIDNFSKTRANYKPKNDTSQFDTVGQIRSSIPAPAPAETEEPDFLAGIELPEEEKESKEDDLPF